MSAGGQIALSASIWLRDNNFAQPGRLFLIAPALDLSLKNPAIEAVEAIDPLAGLAPVTVFSGTHDILDPDTRR